MRNLIYQYYDGPVHPGTKASVGLMSQYAKAVGADHLFEQNPLWLRKQGINLGRYTPHYGQFKVVFDPHFEQYDNVLFLDTDIFPIDGLTENIFDIDVGDIGICTEGLQPDLRKKISGPICHTADERWASVIKRVYDKNMPRRADGLLKVYNSGVVLYSKQGRLSCRERFVPFIEFHRQITSHGISDFYASDQGYLHAMLEVAQLNWIELDPGWNSYVHYKPETSGPNRPVIDTRTQSTKFVHVQLRGADHYNADTLYNITNKPVTEWKLPT